MEREETPPLTIKMKKKDLKIVKKMAGLNLREETRRNDGSVITRCSNRELKRHGVTNPRRLRSCEPPANPARLDDTSNYVNSRCIEPSGTRCHFGKPPVFIRPRTWAPIFFFFLSDPCTLAHTQGSLESLRFRFKQCAFCPSLRFPTEILSLSSEFSFYPFFLKQYSIIYALQFCEIRIE